MSTIKADAVTTKSDNTDLTITGGGTGVPNLEAGFKVGGTVGVPISGLQVGTDGELITWDASGDPAAVAVGTATHVLTSNGAGAAPTFQAAGGGAWTLIGTQVASASASLTQTGLDSTYDTYAIGISDIKVATDGVNIICRLGDSSGIDSGSTDYSVHIRRFLASSETPTSSVCNAACASIGLDGFGIGNAAGEGYGGLFYLHGPGDGTTWPLLSGNYTKVEADNVVTGGTVIGARVAVISLDRIQILLSSGNITSGRMTVWGISHA
jgi:hypothetical protein